LVPNALGQTLTFVEGEGPNLAPRIDPENLAHLHETPDRKILAPVFETVRRVRTALEAHVAVLGFCGAPWTVATYMVAGAGTPDQGAAKLFAYQDRSGFERLIERLVVTSIDYLVAQISAGADAVQIFDTWSGALAPDEFERWCIAPVARIVAGVRS